MRGNATFSALFVLSLLHMFVWVLLSPSTTLVVTCAGLHILFQVPMLYSAPVAYAVLLGFFVVCVTQPRDTQRLVTQAVVAVMAGLMVAVSVGFVYYVVDSLRKGEHLSLAVCCCCCCCFSLFVCIVVVCVA